MAGMVKESLAASFRDPSGFLFKSDSTLYRQIEACYRDDYDRLMSSGLYTALVKEELLIPHREVSLAIAAREGAYKVIEPEVVGFISYPYEWCFSQLKDAALATLAIQRRALDYGMTLKDASAYNIQFLKGRPVLIDTLSFTRLIEGRPWQGYRQYCQHFLAPLALMACCDVRMGQLLRVFIDGIPLDLASRLLPVKTRLNFALLSHIHLHAKSQGYFADKPVNLKKRKMSPSAFKALLDYLVSSTQALKWLPAKTEWAEYYDATNYTDESFRRKGEYVKSFIEKTQPQVVWDLGANTGVFSRLASEKGIRTIAFDIDPGAVEKNYLECVRRKEKWLLPLVLDLTNPSPASGWENMERMSFMERSQGGMVLALALVHHLAISNNLPLSHIAHGFQRIGRWLVIEFVPKNDSQVQRLLMSREDIFPEYDRSHFEEAFREYYNVRDSQSIPGSERTLYLMERKVL